MTDQELLHDLEMQRDRVASLLRVAQVASCNLSMKEVLTVISQEVVRVLALDGCNCFMFPERTKQGYYFMVEPLPPSDYRVPDPPDGFCMDALRKKEVVTSYSVMDDPRTDKRTLGRFGVKSALAFPLIFQDEVVAVGFASMFSHRCFTEEEISLVKGIASSGAVAVANVRLHEARIQVAVAEERNRLAREMHDDFAQALAVTKLHINTLLMKELPQDVKEELMEMREVVEEAYIELRDAIFGLRSINGLEGDFLDNLRNYIMTFATNNKLEIESYFDEDDFEKLNSEAMLQASRIIAEALNNIRKHSHASHVRIESIQEDGAIIISIADNGIGMSKNTEAVCGHGRESTHVGIPIMHERAQSIGGSLELVDQKPNGTCVRLRVPYR